MCWVLWHRSDFAMEQFCLKWPCEMNCGTALKRCHVQSFARDMQMVSSCSGILWLNFCVNVVKEWMVSGTEQDFDTGWCHHCITHRDPGRSRDKSIFMCLNTQKKSGGNFFWKKMIRSYQNTMFIKHWARPNSPCLQQSCDFTSCFCWGNDNR